MVTSLGAAGTSALAAGVVAAIVAAVLLLPDILAPRLVTYLERQAERSLAAEVTLGEPEIALFDDFPNLRLRTAGLTVTGEGPFEGQELLHVDALTASLDVMSLLRGPIQLESLALTRPRVSLIVDAQGRANYDIAETGSGRDDQAAFRLRLERFVVDDLALSYDDRAGAIAVTVSDLDHRATGALTQDRMRLETRTDIGALTLVRGGTTWLADTRWGADVAFDLDLARRALTLADSTVRINDLTLALQGSIAPAGDDLDLDLTFRAPETGFKSLLSLVPGAYVDDFGDVDATGSLALQGHVKGRRAARGDHLPGMELAVQVADARFQYPDLPTAVEDIALDLALHHPEGPADLAVIEIPRFHFAVAGSPLDGRLVVKHPWTDPVIDTRIEGKVDLGALASAFPIDDTRLSGTVTTDLHVAGAVSAFAAQRVDGVVAEGTFRAQGVRYGNGTLPTEILVESLDLTLSPEEAQLREGRIRYGDSDAAASGEIAQILPYLMADGVLTGTLAVESEHLDLRPFQGGDAEGEDDADGGAIVPVPTDLDLTLDADLGSVFLDDWELESVEGRIHVKDGTVRLEAVEATLLGGKATVSGTYTAPTAASADVALDVTAVRLDVARTITAFETIRRMAPVMDGAVGTFDSGFVVRSKVAKDGTPDLSMLASKGNFLTYDLVLGPSPLQELAKRLRQKKYGSIDLHNNRLAYEIERGQLRMLPFAAKLGGVKMNGSGTADVSARTLDFTLDMKLPTKGLEGLGLLDAVQGVLPAKVDLAVRVHGPYDKPMVAIDVGERTREKVEDRIRGEVEPVVDEARNAALAEAQKKGEAVLAQARAAGDKLRAESKKAADRVRAETDRRADDLVKSAKGLKKKAAQEVAKKMRAEGERQAKKIEKEGDKAARKLENEAEDTVNLLLAEAVKVSQ